MELIIIAIFIVAYLLIAFEEQVKLNKAVPALLAAALIWSCFALGGDSKRAVEQLAHHLSDTAGIIFFIWGALIIVKLTDAHEGFRPITDRITTRDPRKLIWITCFITFLLAAVIDNLTAAIVMATILHGMIKDKQQRAFFACMAVVAANAGGTWSPLGEITTTMLWAKGQISIAAITTEMFIPSLICLLVPLIILSFFKLGKGFSEPNTLNTEANEEILRPATTRERNIMLAVSILGLLFIPIFKYITHLPPYMGMLFSLGLVWLTSELLHNEKDESTPHNLTIRYALEKVDASNLLFFLGILLAVSGLEASGILKYWGDSLLAAIPNIYTVDYIIGLVSALIDNVPLVAAMQGMYSLEQYPIDHPLWIFLSYTAGTGGSILVIGSAAGVGVMGMSGYSTNHHQDKGVVDFWWFAKNISLWAFIGYCAGAATYLLLKTYVY